LKNSNEENFNSDMTDYDLFFKKFSNLNGFMGDGYEKKEVTLEKLKKLKY
jgi:enoyl-[acyl-carrier protein] reductase/trans-2-enoyl-CoA reductase (NAD+)